MCRAVKTLMLRACSVPGKLNMNRNGSRVCQCALVVMSSRLTILVIQEVEKGEGLWQAKAKRRELRAQRAIDQKAMQAQESSSQRSDTSSAISKAEIVDEIEVKQTPGFY